MTASLRLYGLAFILILATAAASRAQEAEVYTIYGIDVDKTADTAAQARRQARAQARLDALGQLVSKLSRADPLPITERLSDRDIADLVSAIEQVEERSSATRYIATYNVSFAPQSIRRLFGEAGVAFSDRQAPPLLVLPVQLNQGALLLWERENVWANAWRDYEDRNSLLDLRLAPSSFANQQKLSAAQAGYGDERAILDFAGDFEARQAAVIRLNFGRGAFGRQYADFAIQRFGPGTPAEGGRVWGGPDIEASILAARAVEQAVERLEAVWIDISALRLDDVAGLKLRAYTPSLADWARLDTRLKKLKNVQAITLERLSVPLTIMRIEFAGGRERFERALERVDLKLARPADPASGSDFLTSSERYFDLVRQGVVIDPRYGRDLLGAGPASTPRQQALPPSPDGLTPGS